MDRRQMVRGGLALAAGRFRLAGCTTQAASPAGAQEDSAPAARGATAFDAIITRSDAHDASGAGSHDASIRRFATVQAALDAAPRDATRPFRVLVTRGRWHEKLVIEKPFIHLIGEDRDDCVLTHDTAAGHRRADGEPWGTWGWASLIVRAPDFAASNLTIENAFDYLGHLREPKLETVGPNGAQAVALLLDTGSERAFGQDARLSIRLRRVCSNSRTPAQERGCTRAVACLRRHRHADTSCTTPLHDTPLYETNSRGALRSISRSAEALPLREDPGSR